MAMSREHIVSRTLMAGIAVSAAFMLTGFLLYAFQPTFHDADIPQATWKWLSELSQRPVMDMLRSPWLFFYTGILLLMATPIVRIMITAWTFWRERDMHYVWISLIVLAVIGISITFSITH